MGGVVHDLTDARGVVVSHPGDGQALVAGEDLVAGAPVSDRRLSGEYQIRQCPQAEDVAGAGGLMRVVV